jgi:hypothetical protein
MLLVIEGKIYIKIYKKHYSCKPSSEEELYYILNDILLNCYEQIDKVCVNQFLFELTKGKIIVNEYVFDTDILYNQRYLRDVIYWLKSINIDMFHFCQKPNRTDVDLSEYMIYTTWHQTLLVFITHLEKRLVYNLDFHLC